MTRTSGIALLALTLAFVGCGDDDDGGPAGPGGGAQSIPFDDVLPLVVDMQCSVIEECAGDLFDLFLGGMQCEELFGKQFEDGTWSSLETAVDEGRVIYRGDKVRACLDAWRALGCDIMANRAPDLCEEALEGTVDEGGDCTLDEECKGPLFCKVGTTCPGSCSARQGAGSPCTNDNACENGLRCEEGTDTCEKPRGAGEACEGGQPDCEFGLICLGAEGEEPGTCNTPEELFGNAEGEACDIQGADWCEAGLSCVVDSVAAGNIVSTCQSPVGSGEPCHFGIPAPCPAGEYCNANIQQGQIEGTCTVLPEEGDACIATGGVAECAPYHVCSSGTCRVLKRLGVTCTDHDECYSNVCTSGECSASDACSEALK